MKSKKLMLILSLSSAIIGFVMKLSLSATADGKGKSKTTKKAADKPVSELTISGTKATCSSRAKFKNCASITAEQTVEQLGGRVWKAVDGAHWTKKADSDSIAMYNTISCPESGKYRLKTVFTHIDTKNKKHKKTVYSTSKTVKCNE